MTLFDPDPGPGDAGAGVGPAPADAPGPAPAEARGPAPDGPGGGPSPARTRLRLLVAYDGSGYRGFAAQPGQETVAGAIADAVATVVRHPVTITCAGRTDAGVHARGQVVHVDVDPSVEPVALAKAVNAMLAPRVVVRRAEAVDETFDARRGARSRTYRYLVLESETPDPLLAGMTWHVKTPLNLRAMVAGADALLGEHDFRAFCRRVPGTSADDEIRRRVIEAGWEEVRSAGEALGEGTRLLRFGIEAQSFCHQMVRSIVGTLVDVGRGRYRASDVVALLAAGERSQASNIAPPHGLCLMSVDYPDLQGDADPPDPGPGGG